MTYVAQALALLLILLGLVVLGSAARLWWHRRSNPKDQRPWW